MRSFANYLYAVSDNEVQFEITETGKLKSVDEIEKNGYGTHYQDYFIVKSMSQEEIVEGVLFLVLQDKIRDLKRKISKER